MTLPARRDVLFVATYASLPILLLAGNFYYLWSSGELDAAPLTIGAITIGVVFISLCAAGIVFYAVRIAQAADNGRLCGSGNVEGDR